MKLYRTQSGIYLEDDGNWHRLVRSDWNSLLIREDLPEYLAGLVGRLSKAEAPAPEGILAPLESGEVWAAGVTYFRSRTARMEESQVAGGGSFYDRVYEAERPELFFKATAHRVVGHRAAVRIRGDSHWNVPEPELALVVTPRGRLIGYTIGNDMSSRDIEGENPLYLPQAKVYDRSCSLGPCILVSSDELASGTGIRMEIRRNQQPVFSGVTTLAQMKRKPLDLIAYLYRDNTFPQGCVLLTGTGIVPDDTFTLQEGDWISIQIDGVGTLENFVG